MYFLLSLLKINSMKDETELRTIIEGMFDMYETIILVNSSFYDRKDRHAAALQYVKDCIELQIFYLEEDLGVRTFDYPYEDINKSLCYQLLEYIEDYNYEKRGITK